MSNIVEKIIFKKKIFALIIRSKVQFKKYGVNFFTKDEDLIQVGCIKHKKKHKVSSHVHLKKKRVISYCSEVLLIKKGKVKVSFYDEKGVYIRKSRILNKDDIIILFIGGHGFEILKDSKIIEVKQGPYLNRDDKLVFNAKKNYSR